jgi:hypothetical protein
LAIYKNGRLKTLTPLNCDPPCIFPYPCRNPSATFSVSQVKNLKRVIFPTRRAGESQSSSFLMRVANPSAKPSGGFVRDGALSFLSVFLTPVNLRLKAAILQPA